MAEKRDIRALTYEELKAYFEAEGEAAFRATQVYNWLWQKGAQSFAQMTNLSLALRQKLEAEFAINHIRVDRMQRSSDGTIKNAVRLHDGKVVESVLIPTEKRITACVSSQVGCSLDCHFCATGQLARMRNLTAGEIYDQVVAIMNEAESFFARPLTNIVFMGMGEPLMNYKNVLEAIDKITAPSGLGLSPKRITLSTVGLAKLIRKLADDEVMFNLALSLHSARNEVRNRIMPINESNPVEDLAEALKYWYSKTGRRVTYEYVVWDGINDRPEDIAALVQFCRHLPCKVNLIEYNPTDDPRFVKAPEALYQQYVQALERAGITAKIRRSRGKDIDAACGQLANKNEVAMS